MSNGLGDDFMGGWDNIFYGGGVLSFGLSFILFFMDFFGWNWGENLMRDDFDLFENFMFVG